MPNVIVIIKACLISIFLIGISLPFLDLFLKIDDTPQNLKIPLEKPRIPKSIEDLRRFPGSVKYYLENTHGLKGLLLELNGKLRVYNFGLSSSQQVILGNSGWLFYNAEDVIKDYQRTSLFSEKEISNISLTYLKRHQWLESKKISYYTFMAPNKHSIYSEYLPHYYTITGSIRRLDQVNNALRKENLSTFFDLTPALVPHKKNHRLYHKTDTHWNAIGAYWGYRMIADEINKNFNITPIPFETLEISQSYIDGGDLARILGLKRSYKEELLKVSIKQGREIQHEGHSSLEVDHMDVVGHPLMKTFSSKGEINKAIIFRDSFGELLIPFLASHFKEAIWVWGKDFDQSLIETFNPDIVIHEFGERKLMTFNPTPFTQ